MMWLALVVAVVLVALTVAGVMGRIDGSLGPPTTTSSYVPLPEDRLTAADLDGVRLDTAFPRVPDGPGRRGHRPAGGGDSPADRAAGRGPREPRR